MINSIKGFSSCLDGLCKFWAIFVRCQSTLIKKKTIYIYTGIIFAYYVFNRIYHVYYITFSSLPRIFATHFDSLRLKSGDNCVF